MSAIPTYYVSRLARNHVKVVLTGDGGDEMFMGYPWMADPQRKLQTRLKIHLRSLKMKAEAAIHSEALIQPRTLGERYVSRVSKIEERELVQVYTQREDEERSIQHTSGYLLRQFDAAANLAGDSLSQLDYVTIKSYLPEDILVKVDRASMAVSLEPRSPFLDHIVSEFAASIPPEMKMDRKQTKIILRQYVQNHRLMPHEILERQKQGFGIPLENWFASELKGVLEKLLLGRESTIHKYIREAYIEGLMRDRSNVRSAQKLFSLVMFELWNRMFIERELRSNPPLDIERYL
jgi:asparagine synthase (glutamine-hydrolysing)